MTHFPPFSFDPHERTLRRGSAEVPLTPKASALLACLVSARGDWVSKDAILATVWPDTHVQSENIKVLVREIRVALGDSPVAPTFVRAMPRRGYAFVAPLIERSQQAPHDEPHMSRRAPVIVHRRPELAELMSALQVLPSAAPPLILVAGGQGIGKTSLCQAFLRAARASSVARVAYGQCFDRESPHEPYYPILDALMRLDRQYHGLMVPALATHAPSWLTLVPHWRTATAAPVEPGNLLDELTVALDVLSRDLPLAIVLEDLHWADPDTLRALRHLARRAAQSRTLVVATCHEGAWAAGPRARACLADAAPDLRTIALGPFTQDLVAEYAVARFGPGAIETLAPVMFNATGGIPAVVTAAFDRLVERRMIVQDEEGWRPASSIDTIARVVPEALNDITARQLDPLESLEREAVEAAAAAGFRFTLDAAAAALEWPREDVAAALGPLARRGQLLVAELRPGTTRDAGGAYRFRHPYYVEVIARQAPRLRQQAFEARVQRYRESMRRRFAT